MCMKSGTCLWSESRYLWGRPIARVGEGLNIRLYEYLERGVPLTFDCFMYSPYTVYAPTLFVKYLACIIQCNARTEAGDVAWGS